MIAGECLIYAGKEEWCGEEGDGDGQNARNRLFSLICSRFLLFSRVCSHFLLLSLVCTMGNSPADFNMSLRHGVVFSMAGGLCCVLSVCLANSPGGFSAGGRGGAGLQRSATYGRHGMEWGGSGKTASPFSWSGRIVPPHPPNAPTSRGSGKTGHGLSRAVP